MSSIVSLSQRVIENELSSRTCNHLNYTLVHYILPTREARMKCISCDETYIRHMTQTEIFTFRDEVKCLVEPFKNRG